MGSIFVLSAAMNDIDSSTPNAPNLTNEQNEQINKTAATYSGLIDISSIMFFVFAILFIAGALKYAGKGGRR